MAQNTVETIIRKAVTDEAFRALLLTDPNDALSGYDLSDDERTALSKIDAATFGDASLEDRLSRGGFVDGIVGN